MNWLRITNVHDHVLVNCVYIYVECSFNVRSDYEEVIVDYLLWCVDVHLCTPMCMCY